MVNRKPARAQADTGTIGKTLLSNRFCHHKQHTLQKTKEPCEPQDSGQGVTIL